MDSIDISQFGKGAVELPPELKVFGYRLRAEPVAVIDWSRPYGVEQGFTLAQRNQDGSLSCTAQATCYYVEALNRIEHAKTENYSARHIYSQTRLPGGGSYIAYAMSIPLAIGVAGADSVPDGTSTEREMVDASLNGVARIEARADKYAQITNNRNIDYLAQVVTDYGGFVTGFSGRNDMFLPDGTAQAVGNYEWGHAVYVCGYELRNGKKMLKFKNSWTERWGDNGYGYFPQEFVEHGPLFDAYVYAAVEDIDPLSMPITLARDPRSSAPGKIYALLESKKIKLWIVEPRILNLGAGDMWGGFDKVIEKDLSGYQEGNIDMAVSQ